MPTRFLRSMIVAIVGMPELESLIFKNGAVSPERAAALAAKKPRELDLGR